MAEDSSSYSTPVPVAAWLATRPDVETVVVATPDVNGVLRGKAVPRARAEKIDAGGAAVPLSMPTVDFIGEEIPGCREVLATGDGDIFVHRVPRPPFVSAADPATAIVLTDMAWPDGRPVETACRHILQSVVADYAAAGLRPVAALEVEFYLYDPARPGLHLPRHPLTGREMFGRELLLRGGVNKHKLAEGKQEILKELRRVEPVVEEGGFIPHGDHRIPQTVSYENYKYYIRNKLALLGWRDDEVAQVPGLNE